MKVCKRCLLHEAADADVLSDIWGKIEELPSAEKAEQELYMYRLDICRVCDNLISGVCMKCGCYVEFRAAFKKQKCPDTKKKRW